MKKIVVKLDTGKVAIINPTSEATEALLERDALATPGYVSHRTVEEAEIPISRTFRDAWEDSDGLKVNLEKARAIKLAEFRRIRSKKLAELDVEAIKAMEAADSVTLKTVTDKKKLLRDVTRVTLPDDVSILEKFLPEILK